MRLGIGSWTYPWAVGTPEVPSPRPLTAFDLVDRAVELGVSVVQVADNMPMHDWSADRLAALAGLSRDRGVQLEVGANGFAPTFLLRYLEVARALASPLVRVVIDTVQHRPTVEEIRATLRTVLPAFEAAEVDLLIENHDRFRAAELARLVEGAGSPRLGVVYDTANSIGCYEDAERVLDVLAPWVRNVHVKDVAIERLPNRMGFTVTGAPAGQGAVRLSALVERFRMLPAAATLVLEQWPVWAGDVESTLHQEEEWARRGLTNLRRLLGGAPASTTGARSEAGATPGSAPFPM